IRHLILLVPHAKRVRVAGMEPRDRPDPERAEKLTLIEHLGEHATKLLLVQHGGEAAVSVSRPGGVVNERRQLWVCIEEAAQLTEQLGLSVPQLSFEDSRRAQGKQSNH